MPYPGQTTLCSCAFYTNHTPVQVRCMLRMRSNVAQVCRRSWKRTCGSLARFRSDANDRFLRLVGFMSLS
jgi:hypothetical protein